MDIASRFHKEISAYFSITINLKISSFLEMQIDHDVPNKVITISKPVYVASILDFLISTQRLLNTICRFRSHHLT